MRINLQEKKPLLIVALGLVTLLTLGYVFWPRPPKNVPQVIPESGQYLDPESGETVSDPTGKDVDRYGVAADEPVYLGFSSLLTIGVSKFQVEGSKSAFYQFVKSTGQREAEISINTSSLQSVPHDEASENTRDTVLFKTVINRKDAYNAKLEYFDISSVQLTLTDSSGKLIYDSGVVTFEPN